MNNDYFNNNSNTYSNQNTVNGYSQSQMRSQNSIDNVQYTAQSVESNSYINPTPNKNGKNNITKILVIIALILCTSGVILTAYQFLSKNKTVDEEFDINATTSFFLENSKYKYALFNEAGQQLTKFIYTSVGSFVNGTATVEIDNKEGIINSEGKITVPLGKYENIISKGGLYLASEDTEEYYKSYIIDSNGKILYDLDVVEEDNYIDVDTFQILDYKYQKKYTVINYEGKELISFPKENDYNVKKPTASDSGEYITIFYNNQNWVLNVTAGKQLASFNSPKFYCVNDVSEDKKTMILETCIGLSPLYKVIKDGKLYDKTGECEEIFFGSNDALFCDNGQDSYMLDSKLNVNYNMSIDDYNKGNDYAEDNSNGGVDFYQNGKFVKSIPCRDFHDIADENLGIYILKTYYSKVCGTNSYTYEYYKANGEKLFEKSFARVEKFDVNGLVEVSENKIDYYMMDKTGQQVGNLYSSIYLNNGFYEVINNNGKGIMNKEGKEIVPAIYYRANIFTHNGRTFAKTNSVDKKYTIYDLDKNKKLFSVNESEPIIDEHYITVYSNGKTQYYTFDGKMFYEK